VDAFLSEHTNVLSRSARVQAEIHREKFGIYWPNEEK